MIITIIINDLVLHALQDSANAAAVLACRVLPLPCALATPYIRVRVRVRLNVLISAV